MFWRRRKTEDDFHNWVNSEAIYGYGTVLFTCFLLPIWSDRKPELGAAFLQMLVSSDLIGASLCFMVSSIYYLEKARQIKYGGAYNLGILICALVFMGFKAFSLSIPDVAPISGYKGDGWIVFWYCAASIGLTFYTVTVIYFSKSVPK